MAKNKIFIDIVVDDKGTTKRVAINAKALKGALEGAGDGATKAQKGTDDLSRSNKDLDRNMRGTAKMSSNTTKNFSKQQQGMGGLVGAYATLAAQVFAVTAAFQFLQGASDFRNLVAGQEALSTTIGAAYGTISNSMVQATDSQIKFADAARSAAIGTAAGLTSSQLTELAGAAKNVSFALGRDLTDSLNRLVRGVTKAEPELLDELGIILRLETATQKYAQSLDKSAQDLTAFERTQAVANEVLEQAERKFGAMQGMMDPSAAALAQFAKSFDDLANSFRTGVIDTLTPLLQFLSKNTTALAASLALVALPIVKAILPNLYDWRDTSEDLYDRHKNNAKEYIATSEKQSEALKRLAGDEKSFAAEAEKTAKKRSQDTSKGGVGFLAGGTDKGQARAAAQKGLQLAEDDLRNHGEVRTGILKGYTAQEVAVARRSFDARTGMAERFGSKVDRVYSRITISGHIMALKVKASWAKAMTGMSKLAMGAASVINAALSLVGFIGSIVMVGAVIKEVYDYFFPLSKKMQEEIKVVEDLADKYGTLNTEMQNAARGRREYLSGSAAAENVGQVMQSADVADVVEQINFLANAQDKSSAKFKEARTELLGVTDSLAAIDPAFRSLNDAVRDNAEIDAALVPKLKQVAVSYMEIGQRISKLPETTGTADKAFKSLASSMTKSNPLDAFLRAEKDVLADTQLKIDAAKEQAAAQDMLAKSMQINLTSQESIDKKAAKSQILHKKEREAFLAMEEGAAKQAKRRQFGITDVTGGVTQEQIDKARELQEISEEEAAAMTKVLEDRKPREEAFSKLLKEQQIAAEGRLVAQRESIENTVRGVTFEGKLNNLEQSKLAAAQKLELAKENEERLRLTMVHAEADLKDEATRNYNIAVEATKLAKAQKDLGDDRIDQKKEEVALEQKLLNLKLAQMATEDEIFRKNLEKSFLQETQPGTERQQRQLTVDTLNAEVLQAARNADAAATEFDRVYKAKLKEMRDLEAKEDPTQQRSDTQLQVAARAETQADTAGTDMQAANQALATSIKNRDVEISKEESLVRQITHDTKMLEINTQMGNVSGVQLQLQQLLNSEKYRELELSEAQITAIEGELYAQEKINEIVEQKQKLRESIEGNMTSAFTAMITGAKSAKEAFADMAKAILADIAKMIAKQLVLNMLRATPFGAFFGAESGGITPSAAKGGISPLPAYAGGGYTRQKDNYSRGGMARGPQSGYNAVLHGNEAVVPLPDNRHIPVELSGNAGGNNNVTVNVSMNSDGGAQTRAESNGDNAAQLGNAISKAVQQELQNQKRSGGLLSPYGAA